MSIIRCISCEREIDMDYEMTEGENCLDCAFEKGLLKEEE